jgi:hypothetical protein
MKLPHLITKVCNTKEWNLNVIKEETKRINRICQNTMGNIKKGVLVNSHRTTLYVVAQDMLTLNQAKKETLSSIFTMQQ